MSHMNNQDYLICSYEKCAQTFRIIDDVIVVQYFQNDHFEKWSGGVQQVPCRRPKSTPWYTCYNHYHRKCYLEITSGAGTILNSGATIEVEKLKELLVNKYTLAEATEIYKFLHNSLDCRM